MTLLKCHNLSKKYGTKLALDNVNLEVPAGRIFGLLGKNGSGKTTLIKLINTLLTPDTGEILVNGRAVGVESKQIISYLPERTYFRRNMTVKQTLAFFQDFYTDFDLKKARKLLKDLDLDQNQKISAMSKGMQEKVQLVLVMSRKAKLYILDEPLGGVDPATRDYILDTILSNFNSKASLIISTHLRADVERILDEVVLLDNGCVVIQAEADNLRRKYRSSIDEIFRKELKNVR